MAYLSPFSYVLAAQHKDITPMVAIGQKGKPNLYHSVIFCNDQSGIHSIEDLKLKSKDLSLTFSDPASTSGHLVPFSYLNSIGLSPDSSFKQIVFSGSHAATVLAVATGKIDIGCSTREYGIELMIKKGLVKSNNLRVLWESEPIVASPIVMRNDVNTKFTARIKDLYLNMHKDDVAVFNAYVKLFHKNAEELSYIPIDDSLYTGVRNIANQIKDVELLKTIKMIRVVGISKKLKNGKILLDNISFEVKKGSL